MTKGTKFKIPDEPEGRLHLYERRGAPDDGTRLSPMGFVWTPFETDLFGDESVPPCAQCGKPVVVGWTTVAAVCCSACVTVHAGPREPCVLFHKWNKRCWSDTAAVGAAWNADRAAATVYLTRAAAEAAKAEFLESVQRAILVVPVDGFDAVADTYAEVT
jgi:hypothetical protein